MSGFRGLGSRALEKIGLGDVESTGSANLLGGRRALASDGRAFPADA